MKRRNWSRDELILAFNLYCKTPFGRIHTHNPDIIALAKLIDRTPSAVSWKLANFASLDPALKDRKIVGASHASNRDAEIWVEFSNNWDLLGFESEKLLATIASQSVESISEIFMEDLPKGQEREAVVKARVNQNFFRKSVLAAYDFRCCITGLDTPELLNARHIVPWSETAANRVNPRNGLCLNTLHDRAFDRGLITVTPEYRIKISPYLKNSADNGVQEFFLRFDNAMIRLPTRFRPDAAFLSYHNANIFRA